MAALSADWMVWRSADQLAVPMAACWVAHSVAPKVGSMAASKVAHSVVLRDDCWAASSVVRWESQMGAGTAVQLVFHWVGRRADRKAGLTDAQKAANWVPKTADYWADWMDQRTAEHLAQTKVAYLAVR